MAKHPNAPPVLHIYPQPSLESIEETKALYRRKFSKELTDGEAREIMRIIIRYTLLEAQINAGTDDPLALREYFKARDEWQASQIGIFAGPEKEPRRPVFPDRKLRHKRKKHPHSKS